MAIPKVFHQFWIGSALPTVFARLQAKMLALHPDWLCVQWSDDCLPLMVNYDEYAQLKVPTYASDIVRYDILARYGGVWSDYDIVWLRNIDRLCEHSSNFFAREHSGSVNNGVFGAEPFNPIVMALVERLERSFRLYDSPLDGGLPHQVGVAYFRSVVDTFPETALVLPKGAFHPYTGTQGRRPDLYSHPAAYGVHYYNSGGMTVRVSQAIDGGEFPCPSVGSVADRVITGRQYIERVEPSVLDDCLRLSDTLKARRSRTMHQ